MWNVLGPTAIKYDWTVTFGVAPHGKINLLQALSYSCDPYFYTIAYDLYQQNPDFMSQVARSSAWASSPRSGRWPRRRG